MDSKIYFRLTISAAQDILRAIENTCPSQNGMGFAVNPTGPVMGATGKFILKKMLCSIHKLLQCGQRRRRYPGIDGFGEGQRQRQCVRLIRVS